VIRWITTSRAASKWSDLIRFHHRHVASMEAARNRLCCSPKNSIPVNPFRLGVPHKRYSHVPEFLCIQGGVNLNVISDREISPRIGPRFGARGCTGALLAQMLRLSCWVAKCRLTYCRFERMTVRTWI
jgi:hypothetical protein